MEKVKAKLSTVTRLSMQMQKVIGTETVTNEDVITAVVYTLKMSIQCSCLQDDAKPSDEAVLNYISKVAKEMSEGKRGVDLQFSRYDKKKMQELEKELEDKKRSESEPSPIIKQYEDLKKKHPDALLLFRVGDFYETYNDDAEKASKILGITLTRSTKIKDREGNSMRMAGFPHLALDTYLPKLISAGQRVATCDQIEAPKNTMKR